MIFFIAGLTTLTFASSLPKNSGELVQVRQGADYWIAEGSRCCTNAAPEDAMGRHKKRARRLVRRSTRQFIDAPRQSRPLHRFCMRLRDRRRKQHHPRHPPCDRNDARLTARLVCKATDWRAFRRIGSASVRARYLSRRAPRLPKPPGPKHAADRGNGSRRLPHFLLMFQRSVETARLQARRWYAARAAHARTTSFIRMSHSPKRTVA